MTFGKWDESLHSNVEQLQRINSSFKIKEENVEFNPENETAKIIGSGGTYDVSLNECTCADFARTNVPCKHMYKLASKLGFTPNLPVKNAKAAKAFNESLDSEINHFKDLYFQGAISLEKLSKITKALKSK